MAIAPWLSLFLIVAPAPPPGELTYLANEGFLIAVGDHRVLVDALHRGGVRGYPKLPPVIEQELEAARGRFAGVELVLVTHHHADHFDPEAAGRHLLANPSAQLISTPQAVEQLRQGFPDFARVAHRAKAVWPAEGERLELRLGIPGLGLTVLNLHHGRNREPPIENLGFLLELDGTRSLHVGDTEAGEADWSRLELDQQRVDFALLPYWQVDGEAGRARIERLIAPRRIVPMHWPAADAPPSWFGDDRTLEVLLARFTKMERTLVLSRPGEDLSLDQFLSR